MSSRTAHQQRNQRERRKCARMLHEVDESTGQKIRKALRIVK